MTYFDDDETFLIQEIGFPNFDGNNINIKKSDNGNNIGMQLSLHMDDRLLMINPLAKIHGIKEIKEVYLHLFIKLIENVNFNIKDKNNNGNSLYENLVSLGRFDLLELIEDIRGNIL